MATPAPAPATFTQEDVDRLVGQRVAETKRSHTNTLLGELGFDRLDDLKTMVATAKSDQLAAMSEAERLKAEAAEAKKLANAERSALAGERHSLNIERALQAAGAKGNLAQVSKLVDVEVGADTAAVQAAVDAIKADPTFAALFGAATVTPAPSEPSGGGAPSRPSNSPDATTRGTERAKAYEAGKRSFS